VDDKQNFDGVYGVVGGDFDTRFTRYRADGSVIGGFNSIYVVTREDGHWGVKAPIELRAVGRCELGHVEAVGRAGRRGDPRAGEPISLSRARGGFRDRPIPKASLNLALAAPP
jgi:hypothetical protein